MQIEVCFSLVDSHTEYARKFYNEINDRLNRSEHSVKKTLETIKRVKDLINSLENSRTNDDTAMSHLMRFYKEALGSEPPLYMMATDKNFKTLMLNFYSSRMSVLIMELKSIVDFPEFNADVLKEHKLEELAAVISNNKAYVRDDIYPKKSVITSVATSLRNFLLGPEVPRDSTDQEDKEIVAATTHSLEGRK